MTLEELKKIREVYWSNDDLVPEVFNLAEGMLKLAEIAERDQAIVGIYRETWKEDGGWIADADRGLSTLGEAQSDDLLEAIDALYSDLAPE